MNVEGMELRRESDGVDRWYMDRNCDFDYYSWQHLAIQYSGCGYAIKTIIKILKESFTAVTNDRQIYNQIRYWKLRTGYNFRTIHTTDSDIYYKEYKKHQLGKPLDDTKVFTKNQPLNYGDNHRKMIGKLTKEEKSLLSKIRR